MLGAGAIVVVLIAIALWLLLKADVGKPGPNASPAQLAEVSRLKKQGYDVIWTDDGFAHMHGGQMRTVIVDHDGVSRYASPRHRNKPVP